MKKRVFICEQNQNSPSKEKWCENVNPLLLQDNPYNGTVATKDVLKKIELEKFPLVEDIRLVVKNTDILGERLYYQSDEHGIIATFPWWDNIREYIKKEKIQNPLYGSLEIPFEDIEQSWNVIIFLKGDFVYFLEGNDEEYKEYYLYYKVPKDKYDKEWNNFLKLVWNG